MSIPSNKKVSEYNYFGYYIHVLNCIIVTTFLCFLWLSCFNDVTMLLNILFNYYDSYASHLYTFSLIYEVYKTAVGYVCLWESTSSVSKFLHLFNSCYPMVVRSSEVSLSRLNDTKMENFQDNSGYYNVAIQGIQYPIPAPIRRYVYILRDN